MGCGGRRGRRLTCGGPVLEVGWVGVAGGGEGLVGRILARKECRGLFYMTRYVRGSVPAPRS